MKRFKISLALLAIVVAVASAFTTAPKKVVNYKIFSEPVQTVSSGASYSPIVSNGTQIADLGTASQNLVTYNSNNGITCTLDAGWICDAEVRTDNQTVFQVVQGDFR
jgi:hypothetical protein